jgi:hypothetical protein
MLSLDAAVKTNQAADRAMNAARYNRDLNTRAYASEPVETEKVIRAQLMEALMTAQFYYRPAICFHEPDICRTARVTSATTAVGTPPLTIWFA